MDHGTGRMSSRGRHVGVRELGLCVGVTLAGCIGTPVETENEPDESIVAEPPGTGQAPPDGPGVRPPAPVGSCGAPAAAALLTREQYINTVSDLFGFDVRPLVKFSDASGRKHRPGTRVSVLQAEGFLASAAGIADQATSAESLPRIVPCQPGADEAANARCADAFITKLAPRALRRPLSTELRTELRRLYDDGHAAAAGAPDARFANGVRWVIDALLQSPDFLYRSWAPAAGEKPGAVVAFADHEVADRLAYFLWNSAPDEELASAAERGELRTSAQITAQVARMRAHPRALRAREDFYRSLFQLDVLDGLVREDPAYTPALGPALERSFLAGVNDLYAKGAKIDSLLTTTTIFADAMLAKLYGATGPGGTELRATTFDSKQRRGLLTHPAVMTILGEHDTSDPIKRGIFVYRKLLCQPLADPPDDVPDLPPLDPKATTRQRLAMHRDAPACTSCHALFDPLGLAFENFDQLGRFRSMEHGSPIDSSGTVKHPELDIKGDFANGFELLDRLATSKTLRGCLAEQVYEYGVGRDIGPADACAVKPIKDRFMADGDLDGLLAAVATAETFRNRLGGEN